jgi:hypothetical protein
MVILKYWVLRSKHDELKILNSTFNDLDTVGLQRACYIKSEQLHNSIEVTSYLIANIQRFMNFFFKLIELGRVGFPLN